MPKKKFSTLKHVQHQVKRGQKIKIKLWSAVALIILVGSTLTFFVWQKIKEAEISLSIEPNISIAGDYICGSCNVKIGNCPYNNGLQNKVIAGYQGWYGCPGDYNGNKEWKHWFVTKPDADHLTVDFVPSLSGIRDSDTCKSPLKLPNGQNVYLFSSQSYNVVNQHLKWMAQFGIDGVAVQRYVSNVSEGSKMKDRIDHLLINVRHASIANKRLFYVTYDISGADPQTVISDIRNDWKYLNDTLKMQSNPFYMKHNGKPVVELWGFGFSAPGHPGNPDEVAGLISDLKKGNNGLTAAAVIGGVPATWRKPTKGSDSQTDPKWANVYRSYDVISPWSVGRFGNNSGVDNFIKDKVSGDIEETNKLGIMYMPVTFPGFSWYNMKKVKGELSPLNSIPRNGGNFYWKQISELLKKKPAALYMAMFDEMDEGTAIMPLKTTADSVPSGAKTAYLNMDGANLPEDWYLRIAGLAKKYLVNKNPAPGDLPTSKLTGFKMCTSSF